MSANTPDPRDAEIAKMKAENAALVDAVRSAMRAAKAHQAGQLVNFALLEAEMFAALVAAGVEP